MEGEVVPTKRGKGEMVRVIQEGIGGLYVYSTGNKEFISNLNTNCSREYNIDDAIIFCIVFFYQALKV